MRLKKKFYLALSVLALVPTVTFFYAQALMENLLVAQKEGLLLTAKALSVAISDRPVIFTSDVVTPFAPDLASHIAINQLSLKPEIDGKLDEWDDFDGQSLL